MKTWAKAKMKAKARMRKKRMMSSNSSNSSNSRSGLSPLKRTRTKRMKTMTMRRMKKVLSTSHLNTYRIRTKTSRKAMMEIWTMKMKRTGMKWLNWMKSRSDNT